MIVHEMDVKTGFLNGDLDEEIYMNQIEGFIAIKKKSLQIDGVLIWAKTSTKAMISEIQQSHCTF